ncbi:hypothetical protein B0H17DRAFT_1132247 [Mycena rosella]|uniref:Uncharacterized protein n=1 Tax=Mycena rosella TaxID=1033263 RepID=A0AAD7GGI1_MYCRO|nr:hypothetical protein B0H17DRAFT_1132247 [Mycena rosella]
MARVAPTGITDVALFDLRKTVDALSLALKSFPGSALSSPPAEETGSLPPTKTADEYLRELYSSVQMFQRQLLQTLSKHHPNGGQVGSPNQPTTVPSVDDPPTPKGALKDGQQMPLSESTPASSMKELDSPFPAFLPRDSPPAQMGTLESHKPTPLYGLGWVRDALEVERENPHDPIATLAMGALARRWRESGRKQFPDVTFFPELLYGKCDSEPHIYHIVAFNNQSRALIEQLACDDALLDAAKNALKIAPGDEYTLRWYRFPATPRIHCSPRTFLRDSQ